MKSLTNDNDISVKKIPTTRVSGSANDLVFNEIVDTVSVEEPLEVRIGLVSKDSVQPDSVEPDSVHQDFKQQNSALQHHVELNTVQQIAVTMRTPGNDKELAIGFLFTEGIISSKDDIANVTLDIRCNGVTVQLKDHVEVDAAVFSRHSFVASSCGVCGKKTIAAVRVKRQFACLHDEPVISAELIHKLPGRLRSHQDNFEHTGGIHASCLFDLDGNLIDIKEDVGRHNALDKLIGAELLAGNLPLHNRILMLSGRASFELIQKAAHAGLAVVAAVGAPSSLAVQLAEECDLTLLGFVRDGRFNIYSGAHRIKV